MSVAKDRHFPNARYSSEHMVSHSSTSEKPLCFPALEWGVEQEWGGHNLEARSWLGWLETIL